MIKRILIENPKKILFLVFLFFILIRLVAMYLYADQTLMDEWNAIIKSIWKQLSRHKNVCDKDNKWHTGTKLFYATCLSVLYIFYTNNFWKYVSYRNSYSLSNFLFYYFDIFLVQNLNKIFLKKNFLFLNIYLRNVTFKHLFIYYYFIIKFSIKFISFIFLFSFGIN